MTKQIPHWVDGAEFLGTSEQWADVTNPASGHVSGRVALASARDARHVIDSAAAAGKAWAKTSLARRTQVIFAFRELLNARKEELAEIITAEHGKVHSDALGRSPAVRRSWSSPAGSPICSRADTPSRPPPASTCTPSATPSAWWR